MKVGDRVRVDFPVNPRALESLSGTTFNGTVTHVGDFPYPFHGYPYMVRLDGFQVDYRMKTEWLTPLATTKQPTKARRSL